MADPILTFVAMTQRPAPLYLVDLDFTAEHPDIPAPALPYGQAVYGVNTYGRGRFIDFVSAEFSIDGGDTWRPATPQPFDRLHSVNDAGELGPIWVVPNPFRFVWNAFVDLRAEPIGEFDAQLRLTFSGSTIILTAPTTTITTSTPLTEVDHLAVALARRRPTGFVDFLGQGPIVPFRRGSQDFMMAHGRELVKSSIWLVLNTLAATERWGGEIPWDPAFGSLFWTLKHQPADEITQGLAVGYAERALGWEPRTRVESAVVDIFDRPGGGRGMRIGTRYTLITENDPANEVVISDPEFVEVEVS